MANSIQSIPLDKFLVHPDNPNRMSKTNFTKLLRNIERTGRYEPLIVRPSPERPGFFQIINGHHRCRALRELGRKTIDVMVWDVDDQQTDILLATLNRLGGSDDLSRKLMVLKRLNEKLSSRELAKLLPQTAKQIERLADLRLPAVPAEIAEGSLPNPLVFFVNSSQQRIIEEAISIAAERQKQQNKAKRKAAALVAISQHFLSSLKCLRA